MLTGVKAVWPNQSEAAEALGIDAATVMRWLRELEIEPERTAAGNLLPPSTVLKLAETHGRPVFEIAVMLLERADDAEDEGDSEMVRVEINDFLAAYGRRRDLQRSRTLGELIVDLREMLPPKSFQEIEARLAGKAARR